MAINIRSSFASTDKGIVHDIAVPLMKGQIGVLHLGLSNDAIARDINEIVTAIILFSALVMTAGMAAYVGISWTLRGPRKPSAAKTCLIRECSSSQSR